MRKRNTFLRPWIIYFLLEEVGIYSCIPAAQISMIWLGKIFFLATNSIIILHQKECHMSIYDDVGTSARRHFSVKTVYSGTHRCKGGRSVAQNQGKSMKR